MPRQTGGIGGEHQRAEGLLDHLVPIDIQRMVAKQEWVSVGGRAGDVPWRKVQEAGVLEPSELLASENLAAFPVLRQRAAQEQACLGVILNLCAVIGLNWPM
jgi:hypothetical protein